MKALTLLAVLTASVALLASPGSASSGTPAEASERPTVVLVVGAPGTPEYGDEFGEWAGQWEMAADEGGARVVRIGSEPASSSRRMPAIAQVSFRENDDRSPAVARRGGRGWRTKSEAPVSGETGASLPAVGPAPATRRRNINFPDRERLRRALEAVQSDATTRLWLVLIGHGTFDGRTAKFNLRGPDVSAAELAEWLALADRPTAVINCASSSGPFLRKLSAENRIVITATQSGHEHNFARFGKYFARSIADPAADLDKDGQTSLLEAFLTASRRTQEFYETQGRLATEHALFDDNGDGRGTPAAWFRGAQLVQKPAGDAEPDGYRARQWHLVRSGRELAMPRELRRRRDELERAVFRLRDRKEEFAEDAYYRKLESLLIELAETYEEAEGLRQVSSETDAATPARARRPR